MEMIMGLFLEIFLELLCLFGGFFGYWTARISVPLITAGLVLVEKPKSNFPKNTPKKYRAFYQLKGRRLLLRHDYAIGVGLLLWLIVLGSFLTGLIAMA